MSDIKDIKRIAEIEFGDIVKNIYQMDYKIRIILRDNSFVDAYLSQKLSNKFGFHWECRDNLGTIYRYDNFPDKNWQSINTFPYHFHKGSQNNIVDSPFPVTSINGFRAFMNFVSNHLKTENG